MKPGDRIRVRTQEEVIEGTLLPRPEILDDSFLVLKLDTGYNIGIDKKRIKKQELVKEHVHKTTRSPVRKRDKDLPDVSLLSFGGMQMARDMQCVDLTKRHAVNTSCKLVGRIPAATRPLSEFPTLHVCARIDIEKS